MIPVKNERELVIMRKACKITAAARALAGEMVRPGVTTKQIDKAVYEFILKKEREGKSKRAAKIAGLNKFLRIYYARVMEVYQQ